MLICFVLLSSLPCYVINFAAFPHYPLLLQHHTLSRFCFENYLPISLLCSLRSFLRIIVWAGTGPRGSLEETGLLYLVHDNRNHYNYELSDMYQSCLLPKS